jgi:hypothetical protein
MTGGTAMKKKVFITVTPENFTTKAICGKVY